MNMDSNQNNSQNPNMKYLIVCGSTISGIGKGTTISSIGILLKSCGFKITAIKIDPYLNIDAGTMSPYEHGEVYVLNDGGEVDLDLGNYERALNINLTRDHNITSGKVFQRVISDERKGLYLGKTVQMIPHVTDRIKQMIQDTALIKVDENQNTADICLVEIGGTIGDLESGIFFEAIRQFIQKVGKENCFLIMISYVPQIGPEKEPKTKPTQHGVKELKSLGLFPNIIVCRSDTKIKQEYMSKIAYFSDLKEDHVLNCYNAESIWDVPLILAEQNIHKLIIKHFNLDPKCFTIEKWLKLSQQTLNLKKGEEVKIALCGKYIKNTDSYYSVIKALSDASLIAGRKLVIQWLDTEVLDNNESSQESQDEFWEKLKQCDGILVPGGFGIRGVEGKIKVAQYARENKVPFLGICLGMQVAVIEFCRNVLGLETANSKEFDENTEHDVVTTMSDTSYDVLGGTLRLGNKQSEIKDKNTLAHKIYGQDVISERHRHRYEINPKYIDRIQEKGLIFSGKDINSIRMTVMEIPEHPFFFATQFHPEFQTRSFNPSPPFLGLILSSSKQFDKLQQYVELRTQTKDIFNKLVDIPDLYENINKRFNIPQINNCSN